MLGLRRKPYTGNEKTTQNASEAFAALYEQSMPKVFRYISYRVNDKGVAEDLTSAVFEKALIKYKTYNPEKASFSTWIFSIARNTVIDHYRSSHEDQAVSLDTVPGISTKDPSPEDEVIISEERQRLESCIFQLSHQEQEIIALKFGAEMTNRQIASTLGLGESNVGTIIYRAVRKLSSSFRECRNGQ